MEMGNRERKKKKHPLLLMKKMMNIQCLAWLRGDELYMTTCPVVQTASACVQIQLRPQDLIRQV